jgi:hypothetical protein
VLPLPPAFHHLECVHYHHLDSDVTGPFRISIATAGINMQPFRDISSSNHHFNVLEKSEAPPPTDYLGCRPTVPTEGTIDDVSPGFFSPESSPLDVGAQIQTTNSIPLPPPHPAMLSATPSPFYEEHHPDISTVIGASSIAFPTPPIAKAAVDLRLPSFHLLGIAGPSPFDISSKSTALPFDAAPPTPFSDVLHPTRVGGQPPETPLSIPTPNPGDLSPSTIPTSLSQSHKAVRQFVLTQTPPDDRGTINWGLQHATTATGMDCDAPTPTEDTTPTGNIMQQSSVPSTSMNLGLTSSSNSPGLPLYSAGTPWLGQALPAICTCLSGLHSFLCC